MVRRYFLCAWSGFGSVILNLWCEFVYGTTGWARIKCIIYSFNVKINDAPHINTHRNLHTDQLRGLIITDYNNTTDYILIILIILEPSLVFRVTIPNAVYIQFDLLRMSILLLKTCRGM